MHPIFFFLALLVSPASSTDLPWQDLALSIEKDRSTSSDTVTLCRVRVVNRGPHTWPGRSVRFEAVAVEAGVVMARERGRFGLSLSPHDALETLVAFQGLYDRFEVRPLFKLGGDPEPKNRRGKKSGSRKKGSSARR
jgi:hypothetical protein